MYTIFTRINLFQSLLLTEDLPQCVVRIMRDKGMRLIWKTSICCVQGQQKAVKHTLLKRFFLKQPKEKETTVSILSSIQRATIFQSFLNRET